MATFRVGYSNEEYGWLYFTADNLEHAQSLIEQCGDEGEDLEDFLPDASKKIVDGTWNNITNPVEEV